MEEKHPSNSYHLIPLINTQQELRLWTKEHGYMELVKITVKPGEDYSLEGEDETFKNSLKAYEIKQRYSDGVENALKLANVDYRVEYCKSCGGRVKKIFYHPVEVVE